MGTEYNFGNYFIHSRDLFKILGPWESALLCDMISLYQFYKREGKLTKDKYFYYKMKSVEESLGISRRTQIKIIKRLELKKILLIKRRVPDRYNPMRQKNYYKINYQAIDNMIENYHLRMLPRGTLQNASGLPDNNTNINTTLLFKEESLKRRHDFSNRGSRFRFLNQNKIIKFWNEKSIIKGCPFTKHFFNEKDFNKMTVTEKKIRYKIEQIKNKGFKYKDILEAIDNWSIFIMNNEVVFSKFSRFFNKQKLTFFLKPNKKDIELAKKLNAEFINNAPFYDAVKGLDYLIEKFSKSESYKSCKYPDTASGIKKLWLINFPNKPATGKQISIAAEKWHLFIEYNFKKLYFEVPEMPHLCLDYLFQALDEINPKNINLLASNMLYDKLLPEYFIENKMMMEDENWER